MQHTRRQMIRSLAAGGLLLPGMLSELLAEQVARCERSACAENAPSSAAGQAGYFSLHDRWCIARRFV